MNRIRMTGSRLGLRVSVVEVDGMRIVASEHHATVGTRKRTPPAADGGSSIDFNATIDALGAEGVACKGTCELTTY